MNMPKSVLHAQCFAITLTMVPTCSFTSRADITSGQQLVDKLNTATATQEDRIEATLLVGNILFNWDGKSHCKPPQATVGQAVAITQKFLNENPKLWHYDAPHLIGTALGIDWPCQKQNKGK